MVSTRENGFHRVRPGRLFDGLCPPNHLRTSFPSHKEQCPGSGGSLHGASTWRFLNDTNHIASASNACRAVDLTAPEADVHLQLGAEAQRRLGLVPRRYLPVLAVLRPARASFPTPPPHATRLSGQDGYTLSAHHLYSPDLLEGNRFLKLA